MKFNLICTSDNGIEIANLKDLTITGLEDYLFEIKRSKQFKEEELKELEELPF